MCEPAAVVEKCASGGGSSRKCGRRTQTRWVQPHSLTAAEGLRLVCPWWRLELERNEESCAGTTEGSEAKRAQCSAGVDRMGATGVVHGLSTRCLWRGLNGMQAKPECRAKPGANISITWCAGVRARRGFLWGCRCWWRWGLSAESSAQRGLQAKPGFLQAKSDARVCGGWGGKGMLCFSFKKGDYINDNRAVID